MNLRQTLLSNASKATCIKVVNWIGDSQARFDQLMEIFIEGEPRLVQRAAWPLSYAAIAHPELVKKNFGRLIRNLKRPNLHPAVSRNTIRLLQEISVPKRYQGQLMDLCFRYVMDP